MGMRDERLGVVYYFIFWYVGGKGRNRNEMFIFINIEGNEIFEIIIEYGLYLGMDFL